MKKIILIIVSVLGGSFGVQAQEQTDSIADKQVTLGEIVVKSNLPETRVKGDAMHTLIEGTAAELAGSTIDALKMVPNIQAEDGKVEVLGRGAAEVYINGRRVYDLTELERIKSDQILSVDVINNPGARYAATTKAVVRITLKRAKGEGFGFINQSRLGYMERVTGFNYLTLNYRTGGLDVSGMLNYRNGFWPQNQNVDTRSYVGDTEIIQRAKIKTENSGQVFIPQLQINYMFNERHSVGARYRYSRQFGVKSLTDTYNDIFENGILTEQNRSLLIDNGPSTTNELNLYYSGKIKAWELDFNFDGMWNSNPSNQTNTSYDAEGKEQGILHIDSKVRNKLYAMKLVAAHPLWGGKVSFGTEYNYSDRTNLYHNAEGVVRDDDSHVREHIFSGFVDYGRLFFRKLYASVGLRLESLKNDYFEFDKRIDIQSRKYTNLFPTVSMSMPVGRVQLSLSYAQDIERPSYNLLNNQLIIVNTYLYQSGNPSLNPTYKHNLILNAAYSWMTFTAGYDRVKDAIQMITTAYKDIDPTADPAICLLRPGNINPYDEYFFYVSMRPTLFKIWHPQWGAYLRGQNLVCATAEGGTVKLNRPMLSISWNNTIDLPWKLRFSNELSITTKGDYANYQMHKASVYAEFGLSRIFDLKKCGTLEVNTKVATPFSQNLTTYSQRELILDTKGFMRYHIGITWKFNEAKSKYKGSGAGGKQKSRMGSGGSSE